MAETRYIVEVKLAEDMPWLAIIGGELKKFKFRTVACYKMLELQVDYANTDFQFRVTPVV